MTEIEIPDPDEPVEPEGAGSGGTGPYRNLLVPLVVVPALIVMVLVGIFALFGGIVGKPPTPEENLEKVLHGGKNERKQAAFALMRQVLEEAGANADGGAVDWELKPGLEERIESAWKEVADRSLEEKDDVPIALALTVLVAELHDPAGIARLAEMTRLPQSLDPDGDARFLAAMALGGLNGKGALPEAQRGVVRDTLLGLLDSDDEVLRQAAAIGLQTLPGEKTVQALRGLLTDSSVALRVQAALSLVQLGDDSGRQVLLQSIERAPYAEEHDRYPSKWASEALVSQSRVRALQALVALGDPPDRATLRRLAEDDSDGEVRAAARQVLGPR